jgi:hypothetical protein
MTTAITTAATIRKRCWTGHLTVARSIVLCCLDTKNNGDSARGRHHSVRMSQLRKSVGYPAWKSALCL